MKTHLWSVRLSVFAIVAAFLSLSTLPTDAEARRLGKGGNVGRTAPSQFQKTPPAAPAAAPQRTATNNQQAASTPNSAVAGAAAPGNRFLGPLAGLAAGLGLAALFSHLGFGAGLAEFLGTFLMIAAAVFAAVFLFRMLRGQQAAKMRPAYGVAGAGSAPAANNTYREAPEMPNYSAPSSSPILDPVPGMGQPRFNSALPVDFDEINFVNSAKKFFVTMQGVFDKGDVSGLREYCSDEVLDHLKVEIEARGNSLNHTEVISLDAQLVGFDLEMGEQMATVAFTGILREEEGAASSEINELWTLSRPVSGGGWVLAGIHNL